MKKPNLKQVLTLTFLALGSTFLMAQQTQLENQLNQWGNTIKSVMFIVTGIMAFVGAAIVAFQYFQGNENAQKNLIRLIVGLVIIGAIELIIGIFI